MIPLSVPVLAGKEWEYIKDCLDTGWVSSAGSYVTNFEEKIARYVGTSHAVATVNGTAALHVSLIGCGVSPGDEVIVPTLTFIAPINAVRYCGAEPVFMDSNKDNLCLDIRKTKEFLERECEKRSDGCTYNKRTGRRIKAIIPVHIFGHPAAMDEMLDVCEEYNIDIIEDATESLGSEYKGKKTGSFGRAGCFSFNGNKIITTGGGGMVVTSDENLAKQIRHLTTQAKRDPFEYDHDAIGYNYRLPNILAAMGMAQMEQLDNFIIAKRRNAGIYKELLKDLEQTEFMWGKSSTKSNFWFYALKVCKEDKNPLMKFLLKKNIQVRPIWKLNHTLQMYRECQSYKIKEAPEAYERYINLPCSANLEQEDIKYVVSVVGEYFKWKKS